MLTLLSLSMLSMSAMYIPRWKWMMMFSSLSVATLLSITLMNTPAEAWSPMSLNLAPDALSSPLMVLSCWLAPLCLLAQKNMKKKSPLLQKKFLLLTSTMMFFLILTFSSLSMLSFFMCFEATLIPTLMLMTRWGAKMERIQAGMYFLFYTLFGSLPLLVSILIMQSEQKTMMFPLSQFSEMTPKNILSMKVWWMMTMTAFLVKMPMYGFHLWLPKAHVEAPVAGSMILAAMLLKLGGYGLARTVLIFPQATVASKVLLIMCCWGSLITSMMCLRQTDLKALMAYSSVGHMSLVAGGMLLNTYWSMSGALMLMIAHGLVSSALFSLAKMLYERTHTRKMFVTRGFKTLTALLPLWWLVACAAKLGLPPLPKLIGEILMMSGILGWSKWLLPVMGLSTVFGAMYSLSIYQKTKTQTKPSPKMSFKNILPREHLTILLHLMPLLPLMMAPESCMM